MQNKLDLAEEMGVTGFWMEEGFLAGLIAEPFGILERPTAEILGKSLGRGNWLVYADSGSPLGKMLEAKLPGGDPWREILKSNQYRSDQYRPVHAFLLENGSAKLFAVCSPVAERLDAVRTLINGTLAAIQRYDLHRGWPGIGTRHYSVTCWPGHPLQVIGQSLNQGNDWILFSGYMDFMLQQDLKEWLAKVGFDKIPFVADVGSGKATRSLGSLLYGCRSYDGFQPQDIAGEDEWIRFAHERGGYVFRPVYGEGLDRYRYDGVIGGAGNKEQVDEENTPFIITCGEIKENVPPCMVLFVDKGTPLSRDQLYSAMLNRRNVAVLERGQMMGPKPLRQALQMLLLDRVFLEEYYGDQVQFAAETTGNDLSLTLTNVSARPVSGTLNLALPPELTVRAALVTAVTLPAGATCTLRFPLLPSAAAMGRDNPVGAAFHWQGRSKRALTVLQLPRAISVQPLLFAQAPRLTYPVTVHNFSADSRVPVELQVSPRQRPDHSIIRIFREARIEPGSFATLSFDLKLSPGHYRIRVQALGVEQVSQLGVGEPSGTPKLYEVDLNHDGINEYRMENNQVRVTLLRTGARVIEYIVKERNDNIFFKLWPEKEDTDRAPFRKRGFYPYGGFEDFLGQASMETHRVYDAEVLKKEGAAVSVRMSADYYGNRLEKTFTLYGDSPLLEVRFALTFRNPEANLIGPQPILELGDRHWTEDAFFIPAADGIKEFRMRPDEYYGRAIQLAEGWNAGYDSQKDVSFVGAFPVSEPLFLHLWMNHPVQSRIPPLLRRIPALGTYFSTQHHVLFLLHLGRGRALARGSSRPRAIGADYPAGNEAAKRSGFVQAVEQAPVVGREHDLARLVSAGERLFKESARAQPPRLGLRQGVLLEPAHVAGNFDIDRRGAGYLVGPDEGRINDERRPLLLQALAYPLRVQLPGGDQPVGGQPLVQAALAVAVYVALVFPDHHAQAVDVEEGVGGLEGIVVPADDAVAHVQHLVALGLLDQETVTPALMLAPHGRHVRIHEIFALPLADQGIGEADQPAVDEQAHDQPAVLLHPRHQLVRLQVQLGKTPGALLDGGQFLEVLHAREAFDADGHQISSTSRVSSNARKGKSSRSTCSCAACAPSPRMPMPSRTGIPAADREEPSEAPPLEQEVSG